MRDNRHHTTDEDADAVQAARRGDLAAFELLVHRHQAKMFSIAFRITGAYEDACEVVQDAFLAAHRGLQDFRGDARFSTWLTTITSNLSRNRLQQLLSRRRNEPVSLDDPLPGEDGAISIDPPSPLPDPLELLERRSVLKRVRDCIEGLPLDSKEVLVLRDMEEYSYEEIGSILKLRDGTVKSRLARAREAMRNCLKKGGAL